MSILTSIGDAADKLRNLKYYHYLHQLTMEQTRLADTLDLVVLPLRWHSSVIIQLLPFGKSDQSIINGSKLRV